MRFGLLSTSYGDWQHFRDYAQQAEALGFDSIWVYDHPLSFGSADCWIALSELARATSTVRLGSSVSCAMYRHPAVLARMAADIDQLSGGRLVLGLGIGDDPAEFAQLGIPFGPARDRQRVLEEQVREIRRLWDGAMRGGPAQQPHVPILIAGGGEQVTLRQVADHADACNFGPLSWTGGACTDADVARKYDALRKHCAAAGRPYDRRREPRRRGGDPGGDGDRGRGVSLPVLRRHGGRCDRALSGAGGSRGAVLHRVRAA
ncbi:hypothetical protein GCM10027569_27610 [Flindersiella endophytica]